MKAIDFFKRFVITPKEINRKYETTDAAKAYRKMLNYNE